MKKQVTQTDVQSHDPEVDEELEDVLPVIIVVSKRLAKKHTTLSQRAKEEGGKTDGQNELTLSISKRAEPIWRNADQHF